MTNAPEEDRREGPAIEKAGPGQNNEEETEKLNHRGPGAFTETPAIVQAAPPASPLRFYARLRHQLESRGIDYDALPRLTPEGKAPPCFQRTGVSFNAWLAAASLLGATVPYRYDMPAEPNYCWDCTRKCQAEMTKRNLCLFPDARFETARNLVPDEHGRRIPETEVMGVSRPERVDTDLFAEYDPANDSCPTSGDDQ